MLYQKLLMGTSPYIVSVGKALAFEEHRHPEIEISYCVDGAYDIICEKKRCSLGIGDFVVVGPMRAHEFLKSEKPCHRMTIELGYTLLGEFFEALAARIPGCYVFQADAWSHSEPFRQAAALLEETVRLHGQENHFRKLSIQGNLYKISALLLQILEESQNDDTRNRKITNVEKIDLALERIYNCYYMQLNVEDVSTYCGYSKSNFCKIFKEITGETFHNTLNSHRIDVACMLLHDTNYTIEKIAQETGFTDIKSFCRVFKKHKGQNASEYRKNLKEK